MKEVSAAAAAVRKWLDGLQPTAAIVLGSGLGGFAAQCALIPVLARTHGRRGAMAGACVVLPMWTKRVLGNTTPEAWTPGVVLQRLLFDRDADIAESGRA